MNSLKRSTPKNGLKRVVFKSSVPDEIAITVLDKYAVMEILKISDRTLRKYLKCGYLAYSVIGHRYYFLYSDVLLMLERFRVEK